MSAELDKRLNRVRLFFSGHKTYGPVVRNLYTSFYPTDSVCGEQDTFLFMTQLQGLEEKMSAEIDNQLLPRDGVR